MATSTQRASSRFDRSPWECPYALIPLVEVEPYADPTGYFQNAGIGLRQPRPDSRRPTVYDGDDNAPVSLYFHRGSGDLAARVVGALAARCGPFILVVDNESPVLIRGTPG